MYVIYNSCATIVNIFKIFGFFLLLKIYYCISFMIILKCVPMILNIIRVRDRCIDEKTLRWLHLISFYYFHFYFFYKEVNMNKKILVYFCLQENIEEERFIMKRFNIKHEKNFYLESIPNFLSAVYR